MSIVSQANATPLANTSDGNVIGDIGYVTTGTYGQVFVAPVSCTFDRFTFNLALEIGEILGAVGT